MGRSKLAVVIPAFNEEDSVSLVVMRCKEFGEIVVVDDGSKDSTRQMALEAGAHVISHKVNRGYDEALNTGFKYALSLDCDYVVTLDADGQHNPTMIEKFRNCLMSGADCVVGVRDKKQRLMEVVFGAYTKFRYGIDDPLCGMKGYKMSLYKKMGFFDSYGGAGTQLMLFAARTNLVIRQLSILTSKRVGHSKFGNNLAGNYKIFKAFIKSFLI